MAMTTEKTMVHRASARGVVDNLASFLIGGLAYYDVTLACEDWHIDLSDPQKQIVAGAVALAFFGGVLALGHRDSLGILRAWRRRSHERATGDKIAIIVASLAGDEDGHLANRVVLSLRDQLGDRAIVPITPRRRAARRAARASRASGGYNPISSVQAPIRVLASQGVPRIDRPNARPLISIQPASAGPRRGVTPLPGPSDNISPSRQNSAWKRTMCPDWQAPSLVYRR